MTNHPPPVLGSERPFLVTRLDGPLKAIVWTVACVFAVAAAMGIVLPGPWTLVRIVFVLAQITLLVLTLRLARTRVVIHPARVVVANLIRTYVTPLEEAVRFSIGSRGDFVFATLQCADGRGIDAQALVPIGRSRGTELVSAVARANGALKRQRELSPRRH